MIGWWERMKLRVLLGAGGVLAFAIIAALAWQLGQAHGTVKKLTAERDGAVAVGEMLIRWADQACEATGAVFRPDGAAAKDWGRGCLARVRHLARFETDAVKASQAAMAQAMADQQRKQQADAEAARRAEAKRHAARRQMEGVNARVQNDEVGGDWFARLNQLGGLRRPGEERELRGPLGADGPGAADQGDAAGRPDRLPGAG